MLLKRTGRAAIAFGVSLVLLVVSSLAFVTSADAGTVDDEQLFIQMINQLRTDKGLNPLVVDGELTAQARAWSQSMAAHDQLAHTSNLAGGISSPWTVLGENVGVHVIHDVSGLFQAFIASPSHYQNLVDPRFQYVGVGVVNTEAGKLWTTHRFMAATAPPAPAPPTTAAPTTTA
ncbi:MAG: CAP domain-containing protein, partial [Acidimicrobiales bacterium]